MRTAYRFFCLVISILFISATATAQTTNFDETWREFLVNNKISNMSALGKPDQVYKPLDYAKYLLMNTNTNFCQSKIEGAEVLMEEIQGLDTRIPQAIPGYVGKMDDLSSKIEAYRLIDVLWKQFLRSREVKVDELEAITAAKSSCEKRTLAKYSYMIAYHKFCQGDVAASRDIFENRTLKLAEKTTLRVQDVEGLAEEVAKMKALYQDMTKLDIAWDAYVKTGVSPGFDIELPLFPCYPIPKMKELMLKGALDLCSSGPSTLEQIKDLQVKSGVELDREMQLKIRDFERGIAENDAKLAALNEAWEAFIPDNKVKHMGRYGYEYCEKEALIRAYIMDGFAYVCEMADDMLQQIEDIQRQELLDLAPITLTKIDELEALSDEYRDNGMTVERLWNSFVYNDDTLLEYYESEEQYCDNIHQVKDWTMKGLSGTCEEGIVFLQQIGDFQARFEFSFTEDLECRVQRLRIKVWECRHEALVKLANIEATDEVSSDERLAALMVEYGLDERPADCNE